MEQPNLNYIKELSEGESFGELALLSHKKRNATIIAKTNVHFAVLEKQAYNTVLEKKEAKKLELKVAFFKGLPYFTKWTKTSLQKFIYFFTLKKVHRN